MSTHTQRNSNYMVIIVLDQGDKKDEENNRNYCEYYWDRCCYIFKLSSWNGLWWSSRLNCWCKFCGVLFCFFLVLNISKMLKRTISKNSEEWFFKVISWIILISTQRTPSPSIWRAVLFWTALLCIFLNLNTGTDNFQRMAEGESWKADFGFK